MPNKRKKGLKMVTFYVTANQKRIVQRLARRDAMNVAEWLRWKISQSILDIVGTTIAVLCLYLLLKLP